MHEGISYLLGLLLTLLARLFSRIVRLIIRCLARSSALSPPRCLQLPNEHLGTRHDGDVHAIVLCEVQGVAETHAVANRHGCFDLQAGCDVVGVGGVSSAGFNEFAEFAHLSGDLWNVSE